MAKGRKQKPEKIKVLQGTFRNDRSNAEAPDPSNDLPRSPGWLSPEAREHFGVLKERLDSVGLASKTFTEVHALAAQRLADLAELREMVRTESWDFRIAARYEKAVEQVKSLLSELGLSQVSIGKTKSLQDKEDKSHTGFGGL